MRWKWRSEWCWGQRTGKGGEGQGSVYNVNTVKAIETKGRGGRESRAPSGPILFQLTVPQSCCRLKTRRSKVHTV